MHNRSMLIVSADAFSALAKSSPEIGQLADGYISGGNTSTGDALRATSQALGELKL